MIYVATAIGVIVLAMNIVATVLAAKSSLFTPQQKRLQVILIWVVPIIGAILCLYFRAEAQSTNADYSSTEMKYEDTWLAAGSEHHRD